MLETPRGRSRVEMLYIKGKRFPLREPTGDSGSELLNQLGSHIKKSRAGWRKQILERSCQVEIEIQVLHVDWPGPDVLVVVEHCQRTVAMRNLHDFLRIGAEAIQETNVCHRHDERLIVDDVSIRFRIDSSLCWLDEMNLRTARLLREPYLPHGWEFISAHNHFRALLEI